jgi:ubiquinone/menaquinone biosynthesis C-methylase UbiE
MCIAESSRNGPSSPQPELALRSSDDIKGVSRWLEIAMKPMITLKSRAFAAWNRPDEPFEVTEGRIHDGFADHRSLVNRGFRYIDTLDSLFAYSRPPRGSVILEVGSGLGYIMEAAAARFQPRTVIGLDVAPAMVANALSRLARDNSAAREIMNFLVYDGVSIPLRDESVDYIYSVATLQHIPKPFVYNLFYELLRILKKDGWCNFHLLSVNHIQQHDAEVGFYNEVRTQLNGINTHWHHFYSFDELFYILSDAVKVRQLNIVDRESSLWVSYAKCGPIFRDNNLIYSTHLGAQNPEYSERRLAAALSVSSCRGRPPPS